MPPLRRIATIADVWLNDSHILHTDNMFHRHELDVDVAADNELIVVCRSVKDLLTKASATSAVAHQAGRVAEPSLDPHVVPRTDPLDATTIAAVGMWRPVTVSEPADVVVESFLPRLIDGGATDRRSAGGAAESPTPG